MKIQKTSRKKLLGEGILRVPGRIIRAFRGQRGLLNGTPAARRDRSSEIYQHGGPRSGGLVALPGDKIVQRVVAARSQSVANCRVCPSP